ARASREARVIRGRCLPYGERITFWPLAEAVRQAAAIEENDAVDAARSKLQGLLPDQPDVAERLASVAGLADADFGVRETFWAARKLFERLSHDQPLVVLFEDIHWAEPNFLEMLEDVAANAEDSAVLILCTARPEILEDRPRWLERHDAATRIVL